MLDVFIGVDVIVGICGEIEEYFEDVYCFIEGFDVMQLYVFSYLECFGMQVLKIEYVVSFEEKYCCSQRLLVLFDVKIKVFYIFYIGREVWVLMEKFKVGIFMYGFIDNYIWVEMDYDD